ncbi:MAG: hypothetical protein OXR64_09820 [Chloroflexota bacterium]|nr:hypothetical protein [Chloroflexota bacterium]MDE2920129.1 hypothetical protein [Chloroflexota bacterium]
MANDQHARQSSGVRELIEDLQPEVKMGLDTMHLELRRLEDSAKIPTWQTAFTIFIAGGSFTSSGIGWIIYEHDVPGAVLTAIGVMVIGASIWMAIRAFHHRHERVTADDIITDYRARLRRSEIQSDRRRPNGHHPAGSIDAIIHQR